MKADCYEYVRNYYCVPAYVGVRVRVKDRAGVLVHKPSAGQYVWVHFDGDKRPMGPYHPTDVTYMPAGAEVTR